MTEIVRTDGVLGGDPRIEGTRVGVLHVYELVVEGDHSPADTADQLTISLGSVYTALAYYHDNPEEIDRCAENTKKPANVSLSKPCRHPSGSRDSLVSHRRTRPSRVYKTQGEYPRL